MFRVTCQAIRPSFLAILCAFPMVAVADEPAKRFLERLKDEGLYDQAVKYLDLSVQHKRLPPAMMEDVPLERVILLQESLKNVRTAQQADDRIAKIEAGFKEFLSGPVEHPRRSEARLLLADLYFTRGQNALNDSNKEENKGKGDELRQKARTAFEEASKVFTATIEELNPKLSAMQGANVKPSDTEKFELRKRLRQDYRQAEILFALSMRFIAETYPAESAEWKEWLVKAEAKLSDVVDKATGSEESGRRMLSLLNRGYVQSLLGKIDEARESFNRVADNEEGGIFRTWRVQAVAGIVRLDSSEKSGKYEVAVQRGLELYKASEPRERDESEWVELQLAIAKARLQWIKKLDSQKDAGPIRNIKREAREALQDIVKRPVDAFDPRKPLQAEAKKLLSEIGIEAPTTKVSTNIPETKTFADAIKAARERLDRAESGESAMEILMPQLDDPDPQTKAAAQQQIDTITADALRDRQQAIELYSRAQVLFRDKDSRDDLMQARFFQSYLLLKTEQYWEAIAISQMLMQTAKGTDTAKRSSSFIMIGLTKLIVDQSKERQDAMMPVLEHFVKLLIATAPELPEKDNAIEMLIKLALINQRFDQAKKYVGLAGGKGSPAGMVLGRILWSKYRLSMAEHRKNGTAPTDEEIALKEDAHELLNAGWEALDVSKLDKGSVEGVNTLVSLLLTTKKLDEAEKILNDPDRGAISIGKRVPDLDPVTQIESYRLQLQAMVQSTGQGRGTLSGKLVADTIQSMKQLGTGAGNEDLLTNSLRSLAAEVQDQLSQTQDMEVKSNLADAFKILIEQLVEVGDDASTLDSAGTALYSLAVELAKVPTLSGRAKAMMEVVEKAFLKLAAKSPSDLEAIKRKPDEVTLKLALARRGCGKYAEASKSFAELLSKNSSNITIQVEATKNLEQWSGGKDASLLKKAMLGAEPNDKGKNQIWGWGQIAQVTSRNQNFLDIFFDARLNIARCRKGIADAEADPKKRTEIYAKAIEDIRQTYKAYPNLGGPVSLQRFDTLSREIQTLQSKPVTGLQGL